MIDDNVEVTRVSSLGIWLKARDKKFFLSYYDFPWFKNKPVQAVLNVEESSPGRFYWPEINLKLEQDAIEFLTKVTPKPIQA
ncbi:MAG TPA: DUF2442 domain-containing protein [Spongiibacteraceae bacterium]|jgi:hypothetical protein